MNVIIGEERANALADKHTILSLDTFILEDTNTLHRAYCVVENIPINEIPKIQEMKELHENLITNYNKKNWNFCEQAIEYLMGKWNRELDTFYSTLLTRINEFKMQDPGLDWTPIIKR